MATQQSIKLAKQNYNALCAMLDSIKWKYQKFDENLYIDCSARGDDLAINVRIKFNTELELVTLYSPMPFDVEPAMRKKMAIAVSRANYGMVDGSFDYNEDNGKIIFRMTSSYSDSLLSKELFEYMLIVSCRTVDDYNDKFLDVCNKNMSIDQIINFIK